MADLPAYGNKSSLNPVWLWASTISFVASYLLCFWFFTLPNYASHSPINSSSLYVMNSVWAAFGIYLAVVCVFLALINSRYSSPRIQAFFNSRVFKTTSTSGWKASILPQVSVAEFINFIFIGALWVLNFGMWYTWRRNRLAAKNPPAINWSASFTATAHWCDLTLGLVMIPVSKHSFLVQGLNVSVNTAMRFHQTQANFLIVAATVHGLITWTVYILNQANPRTAYWDGGWAKWDSGGVTTVLGLVVFTVVVVQRLIALPALRRRVYNVFVSIHPYIAVSILVLAALHASSNGFYALPGASLYFVELVARFWNFFGEEIKAKMVLESSGYIRIDVPTKNRWLPSQWAHLTVRPISIIGHPFSAAKVENDSVSFVIKPHQGFTKQLLYQQEEYIPLKVSAPAGGLSFDLERVDVLACFAAGSGITATLSTVAGWLDEKGSTSRVYLFWVTPTSSEHKLSVLKDLLDRQDSRLNLVMFASRKYRVDLTLGMGTKESLVEGPFNATELLDTMVVPSLAENDVLGGFVCGPPTFNHDVRLAFEGLKVLTLLHVESYQF